MDKFTYTTTYKQEFCSGRSVAGNDRSVKEPVEKINADCRGIFIPGIATGLSPDPNVLGMCQCQPGGLLPPRGAIAKGLPTNLDKRCICYNCGNCSRPPIKTAIARQPPRRNEGDGRYNGPPWTRQRRDERRDPDVFRISRNPPRTEVRDVVHGEEGRAREGRRPSYQQQGGRRPVNTTRSDDRIPGPFWIRRRPDERREVDCPRKRKFETSSSISGFGKTSSEIKYPRRRPGPSASGTLIPGPFWHRERPDERREVDALRKRKFDNYYEAREVIHGQDYGGSRKDEGRRRHPLDIPSKCRPQTRSGIPGPFWLRDRPDLRREPDIARRRRIEQRGEIPDVIHGEERRAREWREARDRRAEERRQVDPYDLPAGPSHADPFWLLERADERRNPDFDRRRKFERQVIKAAEIIHGEDFRTRYDPPRREDLPRVLGPDPVDEVIESDDDEAESYTHRRACECGPAPVTRGWDSWAPGEAQDSAGGTSISPDVEEAIRELPAARISCAPQADVADVDQPNAFMRQLYQKYPYLYQVLRETPPEELASRVFKDKFLSTYQVDYLHMGIGREQVSEGGAHLQERMTGPDGEPEPRAIPGCSYRHGERGDFGRKKQEENKKEEKKEKEEPTPESEQQEREEAVVSEYMATISRLGNEIVTDQLYKVSEITKNMKNEYKK